MNAMHVKTIRLKVKPEAYPWLEQAAREVNAVWNWCNETSAKAARPFAGPSRWLTGYDLNSLSAGASECFERLPSATIQRIGVEFATKRRIAKRVRLSWRKSGGSRRSLGWVPFKGDGLRRKGNALRFYGKTFRVFEPELIAGCKIRSGQFSQNALGEWFVNVAVEAPAIEAPAPREAVGIDLGLKAIATTSDGEVFAPAAFFRTLEPAIAQAQRRGHHRQAKRLRAKAANRRKDALHKFTTGIVRQYQHIAVGDVSAPKLARMRFGKAVLDSGWGMVRTQLQYKGQWAGRSVQVVSERNTTRACSNCGQFTGPSGLRQLVVREWICGGCGAAHDRDVNAARNILRLSQQPPSAGTRGSP